MDKTIDKKLKDIYALTAELEDTYTKNFLSGTFCNKIALIYNNQLLKWRKVELAKHALKLGILYDQKDSKKQLCQSIINHYQNRITLIKAIEIGIQFSVNRLKALIEGPRCVNNPEIFDEKQCRGHWAHKIVPPDRKLNAEWYSYYDRMESQTREALNKLYDILLQIKNLKSISTSELETYFNQANDLMETLHQSTDELYKLALISKTYTDQEMKFIELEQKEIQKTEADADKNQVAKEKARNHALRSSFNLQSKYE